MKRILILSACAWLGGCASVGNAPATVEIVDSQKVQLVEQWARRSNVQVIWMNVPTRSVPANSVEAKAAPTRS